MMQKNEKWLYLDILRGFAALLMLANHAAVKLLSPEDSTTGIVGLLNFCGSFAPVVFFFVTGVGYGISHQVSKPRSNKGLAIKAAILVVADIFMRGGDITVFGWNFLGFIALSMVILHLIRGRRNAVAISIVIIFILVSLRYLFAPLYLSFFEESDRSAFILVLLGKSAINNVVYWFTPWLTYPLIGFLFGVFWRYNNNNIMAKPSRLFVPCFILGIFIACISYYLSTKGAIFFRWGTMSINFFIASISCLCLLLPLSFYTAMVGHLHALALRGVSSLAVVPIHYFILHVFVITYPSTLNPLIFILFLLIFSTSSFMLAKTTDAYGKYIASRENLTITALFIAVIILSAIFTTWVDSVPLEPIVCFFAQIILCFMLALSYSKRELRLGASA